MRMHVNMSYKSRKSEQIKKQKVHVSKGEQRAPFARICSVFLYLKWDQIWVCNRPPKDVP